MNEGCKVMNVFFAGQSIISSLGNSLESNIENILKEETGIKLSQNPDWTIEPTPLSAVNRKPIEEAIKGDYTIFEKFMIFVIESALQQNPDFDIESKDTLIIISTTKGNIELLDQEKAKAYPKDRVHLWASAKVLKTYFKQDNEPLIISNACISGVQAAVTGLRKLKSREYKHAVVVGADVLSHFVVSGFQSFKSLSPGPCQPFDKDRVGLSLGEGAAAILMSTDKSIAKDNIVFVNGATANDANHISGPSRTAEGQYNAMKQAGVAMETIDFISAHGTATPYNDDMESIALKRHGLENTPVNSFKGYFGHTLGAAGLIETALSIYSLQHNKIFKTLGCLNQGTVEKINVVKEHQDKELKTVLKLGSGFGGSNAALIIKKL
jgi:3-oxoacyl-[acyl-carrier-protein] synthase-1